MAIKVYQSDQMIAITPPNEPTRFIDPHWFAFDRSRDGNRFTIIDTYRRHQWEDVYTEIHDSSGTDLGADGAATQAALTALTANIGGGAQADFDEYMFITRSNGSDPATFSILDDADHTPQVPSGYSLSADVQDQGSGIYRIEVDLGRVNGREIVGAQVTGDSKTMGLKHGFNINKYADASDGNIEHYYLSIFVGPDGSRMLGGYFSWDTTANNWTWNGTSGNIAPTIGTNAANQLTFTMPSGETLTGGNVSVMYSGSLSVEKYFNQTGTDASHITSVDIRFRDADDTTASTNSEHQQGDKLWVFAEAYGIAGRYIDPRSIPGLNEASNWWCYAKLKK